MARLIGTAGHVDHGKTALIRTLTGIDADRLPEEKRRGMTIDIGFAYLDLPDVGRVSIVDVPGHEKFLTNMLVGALGIDVALLCVAADESVMPQTREHLQILNLLPVDRMVVALTKSDLADAETLELARLEVEELLAKTRFAGSPIIPVSAQSGSGLEELKAALTSALKQAEKPAEGPWYLPIDRVFSVKGHGVVVTGTLARGVVKAGDRAIAEPGGVECRVRSIHSHAEALQTGEKGRRTALNLGGPGVEDLRRGMAVGEPGSVFETSILDARMRWDSRPKHAMRVRVSIGAEESIGRVFLSDQDFEMAQLRLETPVACAKGQPLIVRRYSPPDVLGGGKVAVPKARPRRKAEAGVAASTDADDRESILAALDGKRDGVPVEEVGRIIGKSTQTMSSAIARLQSEGEVLEFYGLLYRKAAFQEAADRFLAALSKLHAETPAQAAIPREKVASAAGLKWSGRPFDRIVASLVQEGKLAASGTLVRDPGFQVSLNTRQQELLNRVERALEDAEINVPAPQELADSLRVPRQAVEEILRLGIEAGRIVRVYEGIYYTSEQLRRLRERTAERFGKRPFPAAEFRDAFGTTRKYAIPVLEYFDSVRFTLRVGDNRVVSG